MCGRFTSTSSISALVEAFGVDSVRTEPLPLRWNVAPTQQVYAVATRRSDGLRTLGTFRWGLVPSWAKDPSSGAKMINARAEGIGGRPAFARALLKRRCIIPADSFYEWQPRPGSPTKLPWAVRRRDRAPMALAGLWEVWRDPAAGPEAERMRSCTIVTTVANDALASIHPRMPMVFGADAVDHWLDPGLDDAGALEGMLGPAPVAWFEAYPVSTLVNRVATDGPELLDPLPVGPRTGEG